MSKKITYSIITLLVLGILSMVSFIIYTYINSQKIEIRNESKYYQISYQASSIFENDLKSWGIWEKNNVVINSSIQSYTVNKIVITLTDIPQKLNKLEGSNGTIGSSDAKVENNILYINIYMSPDAASDPVYSASILSQAGSGLFMWFVVNNLYGSTHTFPDIDTKTKTIIEVAKKYRETSPFIINKL